MKAGKIHLAIVLIFFVGFVALMHGNTILIFFESDEPSQSIGTASSGSLVNGKRLQTHLFNTETGKLIHGRVAFSKNPSWVRHDDHYHVDFEIR